MLKVSKDGGGRGGVVLLSAALPFCGADLVAPAPASAVVRRNFNADTVILVEYVNAPRGTPADSLAKMLRTEDTIPRLPRAVAELTRFRIGVPFFGERVPVSAGLSDVDFFIAGERRALLVDSRRGLSYWFSSLVLMDPVVLELSIEILLLFYVCEE